MRSILTFLLLASLGLAADVPAPTLIRLPLIADKPAPSNVTVETLNAEEWFIIDADVECFIFPDDKNGIISVKTEPGPLRMKGKFAGGGGKVETRDFKGKWITTIESVRAGTVELLIVPVGVTDRSKIVQRTLAVMGARPPPGPGPIPPGPTPPPQPVTSFRVIFGFENSQITPAINNVMYAKMVEDYLMVNTTAENGLAGFWRTDKDADGSTATPMMAALWAAVKPKITTVPFLAVEVNGKAEIVPFPKTPEECLETLKKHRGK